MVNYFITMVNAKKNVSQMTVTVRPVAPKPGNISSVLFFKDRASVRACDCPGTHRAPLASAFQVVACTSKIPA